MTTTPTTENKSKKRAFWLPDTLYVRLSEYVGRHRNAPESMTINSFVREAIEEKLTSRSASEKRKRSR